MTPAAPRNPTSTQPRVPCSGKHRVRLLIGEGNFSYALALINKHDALHNHKSKHSLAKSIIATEYKKEIVCDRCDTLRQFELAMKHMSLEDNNDSPDENPKCPTCKETNERIAQLEAKGAQVVLGVDGTKLHEKFAGQTFKRIHWNVPHDGKNIKDTEIPDLMRDFFRSCAAIQEKGGRVHVSLPQPPKNPEGLGGWDFYQGHVYHIVRAASVSRYMIVKKRKFDQTRYPGYSHQRTNLNQAAEVVEKGAREFIFEKISEKKFLKLYEKARKGNGQINVTTLAQSLIDMSPKKEECSLEVGKFYGKGRTYYVCKSDDDSSDYIVSDGE